MACSPAYWRTFTRGCDSVFWWMCEGVGNFHGFLAPDLSPYAATKDMLADTQIVRDGLGDLLLHNPRLDEGIAILYSMPSECACGLESGASFGANHAQELTAWHQAIWDLGMEFSYVTDRMVQQAPLDVRRYPVLILPRAEALGPEAARAIRAYVEAGGTVIADVRPGIYTDHCQPRAAGCLDELFGITRTGRPAARVDDLHIAGTLAGHSLALNWGLADARALGGPTFGARIDPAVALAGGKAFGSAGTTPLCIVRQVGKGRAVLLNFCLSTLFPQRSQQPNALQLPEPLAAFLGNLLAAANVQPALRLLNAQGQAVRNVEVIRWQAGTDTYLCLLRQQGTKEPVTLALPHAQYLYNLRDGKSLGKLTGTTVNIVPNRPTWLALLPAPTPTIALALNRSNITGGQATTATLSLPGAGGQHALRLQLTDPHGHPADWLQKIVLADAQPVTVPIPTAYNDPPGVWNLTVTDLTGGKTSTSFHVGAP